MYGQDPMVVVRSKTTFNAPLKWKEPKLIFTCSWSDFFIEEADPWRDTAWNIIKRTPQHTYQILTKRPYRILETLPADWGKGWSNVWLGVSVENQESANLRIPWLVRVPATVRFLSCEPLLGPIELWFGLANEIQWIITGGESGPKARLMKPEWANAIRMQCHNANIPFFHKQNGGTKRIDGTWGGRMLDGSTWDGMPEKMREDVRPSAASRGYGHRWRKLRRMILARSPICSDPGVKDE